MKEQGDDVAPSVALGEVQSKSLVWARRLRQEHVAVKERC